LKPWQFNAIAQSDSMLTIEDVAYTPYTTGYSSKEGFKPNNFNVFKNEKN